MDDYIIHQLKLLIQDLSVVAESLKEPRKLSRDEIAAMAMQGMLSNGQGMMDMVRMFGDGKRCTQALSVSARQFADALLLELAKARGQG